MHRGPNEHEVFVKEVPDERGLFNSGRFSLGKVRKAGHERGIRSIII